MNYEIDFIGIPDAGSADAICFRWQREDGSIGIGVYDGGTQKYAEALCELLDTYYFQKGSRKVIDFVVCSHSDQDHCAGLKFILEKYTVKSLYLNIPWNYIKTLLKYKKYSQTTETSLTKQLKESYPYVKELEEIAQSRHTPIYSCFQGTCIENTFVILSPTKEHYINNLVDSKKTTLLKSQESVQYSEQMEEQEESWKIEKLPNNSESSAENETSIILLGCMEDDDFLLTGDAGIEALQTAITFTNERKYSIKSNVSLYQLPHHGGGKNISPNILNQLIGPILPEGESNGKVGFVSAGTNDYHPYKIALNAFIRRGVAVYVTKGGSIHHRHGFQSRSSYHSLEKEKISTRVEKWRNN